ncbi:MAG: DUF3048 domain-containing protein [Oscillospiraceae bacterium]|nr:DUF3048 domain-containing protein [Oscillospiraceae bacterium]
MAKKVICILLCLAFALSFAACGGDDKVVIQGESDDAADGASSDLGSVTQVTASKDAYNFLTGENNMASDRVGLRPYAIAINNVEDSWPQYGISYADVYYECETEGGITRIMGVYSDIREVERIGSVRSLRDQFLEVLYPLDPIIVHIGMSQYARSAIVENNFKTVDGDVYKGIKYFDETRYQTMPSWYCYFVSNDLVNKGIELAGIKTESMSIVNSLFNFSDSAVTPSEGAANRIYYEFSGATDCIFTYNTSDGLYYKSQFMSASYPDGKPEKDAINDQQLCVKNVVLIYANFSYTTDPDPLAQVDFASGGTGYYFTNGQYQQITWQKGDYSSNLKLFDMSGNELSVNPGKTHIGIVNKDYADTLEITA